MSVFKGAGVAIVTPMYDNEEVNYDKLGELLEEQIARGTDAIIICGTTGEASTLTHEEHLAVIKYAVEKVNHRVPVIAGTGSNATDTAIYLSTEAEKYGADALLLVTPDAICSRRQSYGLRSMWKISSVSRKHPAIFLRWQS